ncbi:Oxidase ustYa [Colletotrichum sidae]|uniref:Oxidase ustYa n=1 Tax=Colletotrichum sidae TaxID=1347389 RepID=A0A4R8TLI3_9PEZI|nr:Oxidase ustYa [Colletotrichum sidae]
MFSKWNSSPASMTGRRSSITYTALPDSEFGDDRPPKRRSKCSFIKDWKFLAIFSIVTNMVTLLSLFHSIENRSEECHLGSETLWGRRVPWTKVTIENRQEFIDADPWDSKFGGDGTASAHKGPNPWDSIWFPNWVALENDPAAKGYGYGTPLTGPHSEGNEHDPIPWTEGSQAFGIGVMHQLHCVVSIKKAINDYRYTGGSRGSNSTKMTGHIDHCIEVLRQATLCHGDMALIRPNTRGKRYTGYNGWGNEHLCRDWNALTEVIRDHGIHYVVGNGMRGWTHYGQNLAT